MAVSLPGFLQAAMPIKPAGRIAPIVSEGLPAFQATGSDFKTLEELRDIPGLGQAVINVFPSKAEEFRREEFEKFFLDALAAQVARIKIESPDAVAAGRASEQRVQGAGDEAVVSRTRDQKLLEKARKTAEILAPRPADDESFPEEKKVILQVVLAKKYSLTFGPLYDAKKSRMYQNAYPCRPVRIVRGKNREEVQKLLAKVLNSDEMISHLIINTHGNFGLSKDGDYSVTKLVGMGRIFSSGPDHAFDVFFRPIQTRLLEGAAIVLDSCLVFAGPVEQVVSRAQALLDYFGLKKGRVFGPDVLQLPYVWLGWEMFSRPLLVFLPRDFSNKTVASFWLAVSMSAFGLFLASSVVCDILSAMLVFILVNQFVMACAALVGSNHLTGIVVRRFPGGVARSARLRTLWHRKEALGIKPVENPPVDVPAQPKT